MANWHIAYCMQDVHNMLLYCSIYRCSYY